MPWPMVHFAIAVNLFNDGLAAACLVGSIAPDAIHIRDEATRKDKLNSHLCSEDGRPPNTQQLEDFCNDQLNKRDDWEWKQFILGYVAHIYTDVRWTETLYADFEREFIGDRKNIREIIMMR